VAAGKTVSVDLAHTARSNPAQFQNIDHSRSAAWPLLRRERPGRKPRNGSVPCRQ
jgi:hypothetical protein